MRTFLVTLVCFVGQHTQTLEWSVQAVNAQAACESAEQEAVAAGHDAYYSHAISQS